jgi:competence protein ComEA
MRGWRGYVALSLVWLAILGVALWVTRQPPGDPIEIVPPPTAVPTEWLPPPPGPSPAPLHVDVAGAVVAPGVYRLLPGSIVADAIAAAGGPAPDADLDGINKAVEVQGGSQVYVPHRRETTTLIPTPLSRSAGTTLPEATAEAPAVLINLNTATIEELDRLPGIGTALAQRIVEGRPYGTIEELLRVKGIGQVGFDKLKDQITVE